MRVVIVTGSRSWTSMALIRKLKAALDELNPDVVVHGGALGADSVAHAWCRTNGKKAFVYFPDYAAHPRGAPLRRNIAMLEDFPEATVLACPLPGSRGTYHTMKQASARSMEVEMVSHE